MLIKKPAPAIALFFAATTLILQGCQQAPDCSQAVATATDLGNQGELAQFEAGSFNAACQADYMAAWEGARAQFCDPELAFERAMTGAEQPPACERPAYLRNHQLGANLYSLSQEREAIEDSLARGETDGTRPQQLQTWRMRLRVLEREISDLQTLARIRNLMAPAELPPEVRDTP